DDRVAFETPGETGRADVHDLIARRCECRDHFVPPALRRGVVLDEPDLPRRVVLRRERARAQVVSEGTSLLILKVGEQPLALPAGESALAALDRVHHATVQRGT